MAEYTKEEALAFIDAMRRTLTGKTGFKWLVERLSGLAAYVESISAENERLNAYLDSLDARAGYESRCATRPDASSEAVGEEKVD